MYVSEAQSRSWVEFGVRDAIETDRGDGMQDQGVTAGFSSTGEDGGTILVFVLRRIGSRGGEIGRASHTHTHTHRHTHSL